VPAVGPPLVKKDKIPPGIDLPQQIRDAGYNAGICVHIAGSTRDVEDRVRLVVRVAGAYDNNIQVQVATGRVSTIFRDVQCAAFRLDRPDCAGFQGQG
jgi:hypothetical protein